MAIIGTVTLNQVVFLELDADPTISGAAAPLGSVAIVNTGIGMYVKTSAPDTGWTRLAPSNPNLVLKHGTVAAGSFSGNPKKYTVTFATAFADTSYAVNLTGLDSRIWTIESVAAGSFVINTNANTALTGNVHWHAGKIGEVL
jgi:hypothetical protein